MTRNRWIAGVLAALVIAATAFVAPGSAATAGSEPTIIGGSPADTGEYPFMTAILNEAREGDDYLKQFCGGSLVAAQWVLTAAHCVSDATAAQLAVAVGRTHLASAEGQRIAVASVHVHPSYGSPTGLAHDVALLRLAKNVARIAPIKLAGEADDAYEAAGAPLTVIGWGTTSARGRGSYPDELREAQVAAVSDAACADVYQTSFSAPTMVCAGASGVDSCYGDSGGPLFATDAGTHVQVGVVSWGNGCAKKRFPGVYGEVNASTVRSWITTTAGV